MMQGRAGFEDREGGGTTFYFELPVLHETAAAGDEVVRVLVTEHDSVSADYLAMVLEKGGYRVDIAPDASASKALLGKWKYAAWLLTRRLADGVDALSLIAEVKNQARVIMLAGLTSDEAAVPDAERHRITDWLSKSDSRARILEVVNQAIGRAVA
jgi:DNA-binding response OmpR family regulator